MKYKIKYSLFIMMALTVFASCKKDLDLQPVDTFSDANAFLSLDDVQQGLNGAYARYGAYANDMYVNALASDESKLGTDNAGQGAFTYHWQYTSDGGTSGTDVVNAWGGYYGLIDQVNRVLPFAISVSAKAGEEQRRDKIKGQLLALRAIGHFGLLQGYCNNYNPSDPLGVPLMLKSDPLGKPARNSMGQVMTSIINDLDSAKRLLPAVDASSFSDTVLNPINIAAFQARIALYRKDYDAAITYSSEVINSGIKPLVSGSDFYDIWTDDNDYETLFRIKYLTSGAIGSLWTTTGGQVYVAPSDKLTASYDVADVRLDSYIGTTSSGSRCVNKFFGSSRGGRVVDMKASRIAEMYLIRAEAYAKRSAPDLAAGAADLNALRASRITGYTDETFATATALADAVLQERFKELPFEGFRFFDLKRNNLPVERLASDASPAWMTLAASDHLFVLPIPRDETNVNSNIVQNPGY
ncbi:MAG: RagB/SusD family nutrient uptake outer membrane protein [Ferruginibacter sp.]